MKKIELNEHNRKKKYENYASIQKIETEIAKRIRAEYTPELKALAEENESLRKEEKQFIEDAFETLRSCTVATRLKVKTQVGKDSDIINEYEGHLEYPVPRNQTHFNFVSPSRDNKPFTIGGSCLLGVEVIENQ